MHLKNWSLIYPDKKKPRLSPAYDFVSTIPYLPHDQLALNFGGSRDLGSITMAQVKNFAESAHLSFHFLETLLKTTLAKTLEAWDILPEKTLLPESQKTVIERHLKKITFELK